MPATATRRQRKPLTEVHGSCRWIEPLGAFDSSGILEINGMAYTLYVLEDDDGTLRGYQLVKPDGTVYDIDPHAPHGWQCDCNDATYRPNRPKGCKHVKALQAALAAVNQLPPAKPAAA